MDNIVEVYIFTVYYHIGLEAAVRASECRQGAVVEQIGDLGRPLYGVIIGPFGLFSDDALSHGA